jgi:hypothetical protein
MLDHLFFAVIYAVPNMAYHVPAKGFAMGTPKCECVMAHKLQMQKKGFSEKQNIVKALIGGGSAGNQVMDYEEFARGLLRHEILNTASLRFKLSSIIAGNSSHIGN